MGNGSIGAFLAAPGDRFLAMTGKIWQILRPSGLPVIYTSQSAEHRLGKGLVLLRKQAAGGVAGHLKKGDEAP